MSFTVDGNCLPVEPHDKGLIRRWSTVIAHNTYDGGRDMVTRIEFLKGMVALTATSELAKSERSSTAYDHVEWVAQCIKRMETIKPNMTRRQLLTIFKTEGGLSNRQHRTYVSQDCPYFKIDVEFTAIGDTNGEVEAALDVIAKLSRPYLQFTIAD